MPVPSWVGPALKGLGRTAVRVGPLVWAWLQKNPDVADKVREQVERLRGATGDSPAAMAATLTALVEQVEYLRSSADNATERERAQAWAVQVEKLRHAVAMLAHGNSKQHRRLLRARIDNLRTEIFEAFVLEQVADDGGPTGIGR